MIVTRKTIDSEDEDFKNEADIIKEFANVDFSKVDAIFKFKIVGRKKLEFCILGIDNEIVADLTNKEIQELSDFKRGTAREFSKTLIRKWDKLYYYEDGEFKI